MAVTQNEAKIIIEFKKNSHCFYGMKYWRNWWAESAVKKQKRTGGASGAALNCNKTIWEFIWD